MILNKALTCWVVLLSAFTLITKLAAAQAPSPSLIVVNKDENSLAIVDPVGGKVMGRVPVGEEPHTVAVSRDGKLAFTANRGKRTKMGMATSGDGDSISVVDLAARKELRRVKIGPGSRPHGIFFAGGKVYFSAPGYKLIGCYDPASNQIDWLQGTGQVGMQLIVLNKDVNQIFTANVRSNNVNILERGTGSTDWNVIAIPVGKGPEGIDISPDGKEVWTAHQHDGGVSIIDIATKRVSQTVNVQTKRSNRLKFTPDGRLALISDRDGDLVVLDAVARKVIKRINIGKHLTDVLITPDGSHAYVSDSANNNVAVIDLQKLELTSRIFTGAFPEGLAWAEQR